MNPVHLLAVIPLLFAAAPEPKVQPQPARKEIRIAEDAASRHMWSEAAAALVRAQQQLETPDPVLAYDQGVAAYHAGDLEQAAGAFERAMKSNDPSLAGAAAYNLRNTAYKMATPSDNGGPTGTENATLTNAATRLGQVLQHYRAALMHDPDNQDARANGELAWLQLQEVQQRQQDQQQQQSDEQQKDQQQQQSGESQQDQEQQQDQQQQQSGEQQQDQEQQQSGEPQQDQEQQQSGDQQQQPGEQQKEQQQQSDEQQKDQQQQDQQQQQSGEQQQDQEQQQSGEPQQDQEQQQSGDQQQQPGEQQQDQQQQDQQQQSGEQQKEQQQQTGEQQQQPSASGIPRKPGTMTKQEAERMLQAVRDRERQRRLDQQRRADAGIAPTGKDW